MWRAALLTALIGMAPLATALEFRCLQYGPIQIAGRLVQHTYAGPPDYESVTKGDAPITVWKLQLDERVCVAANNREPRELLQSEIELSLTSAQYQQYRNLLGQKVRVTGALKHGGASHQKRLVIEPSEIRETSLVP